MTNKELLKEIHRDNKAINKNLQRLANIGLIGLLGKCGENAKQSNDGVGKLLVKIGLLLVALSEIVLLVSSFIDYRTAKIEQEMEACNE